MAASTTPAAPAATASPAAPSTAAEGPATDRPAASPTPYDDHVLQYKTPGGHAECDIVIGLDFGTSGTKVVVHSFNGPPGDPAWAVEFGALAHASLAQVLPSRLWCGGGDCALARDGSRELVDDIKLEILQVDQKLRSQHGPAAKGIDPDAAAVAYLSLVLRFVRRWFLTAHESIFRTYRKLVWHLNLGVPSSSVEAGEFHERFRRIGKAAWTLSVLEDRATLELAAHELQLLADTEGACWDQDTDGLTCEFDLFPEVAAEVVGYAWSDARRPGLHLMVDVGASTLDLCYFVLHENEGTDCYSLLSSLVLPLGTLRVHHSRIEALKDMFDRCAQHLRDMHDPLTPIPDSADGYIPRRDVLTQHLGRADEGLSEHCHVHLRQLIRHTRAKRYRSAPQWRTHLPVFLCGGGREMPFFDRLVQDHCSWLGDYLHSDGGRVLELAQPTDLRGNIKQYHRLAVAWGLSHLRLNMGEVQPSHQISDDDPPLPPRRWQLDMGDGEPG